MLASLIGRLLIHYWTENMSATMREAQAQDWIADLREFGAEVVSVATGDWRRSQTKRPTPADIRLLCVAEQNRRRERAEHLSLPAPNHAAYAERNRVRGEEMAREGRDICNGWARARGYADFAAAEADGKTHLDVIKATPGPNEMPRERRHYGGAAAGLGVTATEWKPTPERLARDLAELQARGDIPTPEPIAEGDTA